MAKRDTEIPESELEVLGALWRLGEGTVREVREDHFLLLRARCFLSL